MKALMTPKRLILLLSSTILATGCATVTPPPGRVAPLGYNPRDIRRTATGVHAPAQPHHQREHVPETEVAMVSPADMAVRSVASGAVQVDSFESLLLLAGLDNVNDAPPRDAPLTPQEAARVLALLLKKPVTLGSFPPRMAVCLLLREVLEGGKASRAELLRRVERFNTVAVMRPDGYLAWTLTGRTQQKVGPVH